MNPVRAARDVFALPASALGCSVGCAAAALVTSLRREASTVERARRQGVDVCEGAANGSQLER